MSLAQLIPHERAATTLFQFLGDLRYVGIFSMTSKPLLAAMVDMVKGSRTHAGHKQVTITCHPSTTVNMNLASVPSWSVSMHQILMWLTDCRVILRPATGAFDDPENLYTYLPQHVYVSCTELVIQSKYIYRFDGISETFPNVQHLKLDLQRERDAVVDISDLAELHKNFQPLLSLSISAPEAEQLVGLSQLRSLHSLRRLAFYDMEGIDFAELRSVLPSMQHLEQLELYTELLGDLPLLGQALDLSGHEMLRLVAFQNVFLIERAEHATGMKLRFVPPPKLDTLICITSEGSSRGWKGPNDTLRDQLLAEGVEIAYYDSWGAIHH